MFLHSGTDSTSTRRNCSRSRGRQSHAGTRISSSVRHQCRCRHFDTDLTRTHQRSPGSDHQSNQAGRCTERSRPRCDSRLLIHGTLHGCSMGSTGTHQSQHHIPSQSSPRGTCIHKHLSGPDILRRRGMGRTCTHQSLSRSARPSSPADIRKHRHLLRCTQAGNMVSSMGHQHAAPLA